MMPITLPDIKMSLNFLIIQKSYTNVRIDRSFQQTESGYVYI